MIRQAGTRRVARAHMFSNHENYLLYLNFLKLGSC
jgi:hypothetical protein